MKDYATTIARKPLPVGKLVIHLVFVALCIACVFPFLVIIGTSVQNENDIMKFGYSIVPKNFTWDAYRVILHSPGTLLQSYFVTIATTVIGSIVGMWVTTSYAYAISRKDYRFRSFLAFFVFFTMLFHGGMVPSYILMVKWLGLKNTMLALILPYLISGWFVMLMKGFLQTIPEAVIESAKIDGAGELRIFAQIVLPISKPALATLGLFFALQYWNDWWLTLLYVEHDNLMKLAVFADPRLEEHGVLEFGGSHRIRAGEAGNARSLPKRANGDVHSGCRSHVARLPAVPEIFRARLDGRLG